MLRASVINVVNVKCAYVFPAKTVPIRNYLYVTGKFLCLHTILSCNASAGINVKEALYIIREFEKLLLFLVNPI